MSRLTTGFEPVIETRFELTVLKTFVHRRYSLCQSNHSISLHNLLCSCVCICEYKRKKKRVETEGPIQGLRV